VVHIVTTAWATPSDDEVGGGGRYLRVLVAVKLAGLPSALCLSLLQILDTEHKANISSYIDRGPSLR
jgi:hypothetical protein